MLQTLDHFLDTSPRIVSAYTIGAWTIYPTIAESGIHLYSFHQPTPIATKEYGRDRHIWAHKITPYMRCLLRKALLIVSLSTQT